MALFHNKRGDGLLVLFILVFGGGFGMYHYFTKDISLLTGPVWFNDHTINGQWKWTVQLDINF